MACALLVSMTPSQLRSESAPPEPTTSSADNVCPFTIATPSCPVEGICGTLTKLTSKKEGPDMDSFKQRLQQLREEAAMDQLRRQKVVRRASAVCDDLKRMADACTSHISNIVEGQKQFFRSLPDEELEPAIESKYKECNKGKKGKMSRKEFACAMAIMGKEFTEQEVQECFLETDKNNDRVVSPEEFNNWFRKFVGAPPKPQPQIEYLDFLMDPTKHAGSRLTMRRVSSAAIAVMPQPSRSRARRSSLPSISTSLPEVASFRPTRVASLDDNILKPLRNSGSSNDFSRSASSSTGGSSGNVVSTSSPQSCATPKSVRTPSRRSSQSPAIPSMSRAQELISQLEKRKNLSTTYGRLPGWGTKRNVNFHSSISSNRAQTAKGGARARANSPPSESASPAAAGCNGDVHRTASSASTASTLADTAAVGPIMDLPDASFALQSPTDVTDSEGVAGHRRSWSSAFSQSLRYLVKRDSLREAKKDVTDGVPAEEQHWQQGPHSPLSRLRKAVDSVTSMLSSSMAKNLKARVTRLPPVRPVSTLKEEN